MGLPVLQDSHPGVRSVRPDGAERALLHVAEAVVPGELVRVHAAERIYGTDADAGLVATVPAKETADLLRALRLVLSHPQVEVRGVRVVVHGQDLLRDAAAEEVPDP